MVLTSDKNPCTVLIEKRQVVYGNWADSHKVYVVNCHTQKVDPQIEQGFDRNITILVICY